MIQCRFFQQRSNGNPAYSFDSAAGRYLILGFFVTAQDAHPRQAYAALSKRVDLFNDSKASVFFVSSDARDEAGGVLPDHVPVYRTVWNLDGSVGKEYGALPLDAPIAGTQVQANRVWFVIDPTMRIAKVIPFEQDQGDIAKLIAYVEQLPNPERFAGFEIQAPILVLPNVLEPDFFQHLISLYEADGGKESGFMREVAGKTVQTFDHSHKRRPDFTITDEKLVSVLQGKFKRRVVPQILKAHQYEVTRMERYLVGCYTAEDGGHFAAHRDNTTKGTAHRRFADSVNLNDDFDGGEVSFPEYGPRSFKAPAGGAVVFSCSLLHAVSQVTRGRRYAFLPFLYDDKAAAIREANNAYLGEGVGEYKRA